MPRRIQIFLQGWAEGWAALLFALARTGVCAYRAATQSVVHDEAFTFLAFLNGSWRTLYFEFTANNHLLFSILTKLIGIQFLRLIRSSPLAAGSALPPDLLS